MFNIIKTVIDTNKFDLVDLLNKVDRIWIEGRLTDDERNGLADRAREKAMPEYSIDVLAKLEDMDKRLKVLESQSKPESDPEVIEYPEYEAGKWYYLGDKVAFEGEHYECIAPEGVVCVWSPKDYPAYWQKL